MHAGMSCVLISAHRCLRWGRHVLNFGRPWDAQQTLFENVSLATLTPQTLSWPATLSKVPYWRRKSCLFRARGGYILPAIGGVFFLFFFLQRSRSGPHTPRVANIVKSKMDGGFIDGAHLPEGGDGKG
ncbi:unnamed protein product [Ectocarpus sp. 4 AP-2014]